MKKFLEFLKHNILIVILAILLILTQVKVPYQVNMPGGLIDLTNRVTVDGNLKKSEGTFNMAYVSVVERSLPWIVMGAILPDWDVEPISDSKLDNETLEDAENRGKLYLEQSKNYASLVALDHANIDYTIYNKKNYVLYITDDAKTDLKVGDIILKINGEEISDMNYLRDYINKTEVGKTITFDVLRDGKNKKAKAKVFREKDKNYVGIMAITMFDLESDANIKIDSKKQESGPSGGLMMTLSTYNALVKGDLTKGYKIAGTGTINLDGSVGEIGGVKYKIMGAVKNKADVFFVPSGNYKEAKKVCKDKKYDIKLVKVSKFQDAIDYLEGL